MDRDGNSSHPKAALDLSVFFNATPIVEERPVRNNGESKSIIGKDLPTRDESICAHGPRSPVSIRMIMNEQSSMSCDSLALPWLTDGGSMANKPDPYRNDHYGDKSGKHDKGPVGSKLIADLGLMINSGTRLI